MKYGIRRTKVYPVLLFSCFFGCLPWLSPFAAAGTPDVYFISDAGGTWAIWTVSPFGGTPEMLPRHPRRHVITVNVSPTGDRISYVTHNLNGDYLTGELWLADPDGQNAGQIHLITVTPHEAAAWSHDGSVLVFPTYTQGLCRVDRDGANLQPLTPPVVSHHYHDDPDVSIMTRSSTATSYWERFGWRRCLERGT